MNLTKNQLRGLSFVAENVQSESHVKGAVIFLKMVIITQQKSFTGRTEQRNDITRRSIEYFTTNSSIGD